MLSIVEPLKDTQTNNTWYSNTRHGNKYVTLNITVFKIMTLNVIKTRRIQLYTISFILKVSVKPTLLSVTILIVVMLIVVAPSKVGEGCWK